MASFAIMCLICAKYDLNDSMAASPDDTVQALQREVQRLLGRCLLRLQQYEGLMKSIVAGSEVSFGSHTLDTAQKARIAATTRKTLGAVVGELLGSYLIADEGSTEVDDEADSPEDESWIKMRFRVSLSSEEFARMKDGLSELVLLRNKLVHHFIEEHDYWSPDGCRAAQDALAAAFERIDQHYGELRGWAENLDQLRRGIAEIARSDAFRDIVFNNVTPNESVHLPAIGIVSALNEAAAELAVDGWTPVTEAAMWVTAHHPEQVPAKYGFRSWRQAIHESRLFDLRYVETGGKRSAWFREKGAR